MAQDEDDVRPPSLKDPVLARYQELGPDVLEARRPGDPPPRDRLLNRTRAIVYLAALGLSPKQIAEQLTINVTRVRPLFKSKSFQAEVLRAQQQIFLTDPKAAFMKILPEAVNTARKIMKSKKEKGSTRANVAFGFMDRALGKAQQTINHETSSVRELIDLIQRGGKPALVDIETTAVHPGGVQPQAEETKERDPIDLWAEENL
jgi:hypothetical protein